MRVETVGALPEQENAAARHFSDPAVERALKNFLGAIDTEDSLFVAEPGGVLLGGGDSSEKICTGMLTLRFRDGKLARNRQAHFLLLEQLSELLKQAGSAESLRALLSIGSVGSDRQEPEYAFKMSVEASGSSPDQAGLRWGLGLAHVQQAVLFTSRALRQQLMPGRD
jgi:hypothetical protein